MSIVFKNKMMHELQQLITRNVIPVLCGENRKNLYNEPWVVHAKQPFGGPQQVIEYLGRYTHKIAISNHRITGIKDGTVSFRYKDYADGGGQKEMTLEATEFLRRFCLHILPKGVRKIRHYGFLSNRCSRAFKQQQMQMGVIPVKQTTGLKAIEKVNLPPDVTQCPCCKKGKMMELLSFDNNGPPDWIIRKIQLQQRKQFHQKA